MSILAAAEPVTPAQLGIGTALLAAGLVVAHLAGVFRRGSVSGPSRLERGGDALPLALVLIVGFAAWFGLQVVYSFYRAVQHGHAGTTQPFTAEMFTPQDFGFLSTVPLLCGLLVLLVGDRLAGRGLPARLGWSASRFPAALLPALLGGVIVIPLLFGATIVLEWLYQAIRYEHPAEHELLKVLGGSADAMTSILILVGATLMAPVFEEFLFRGHLQTVLTRAFATRRLLPQEFSFVQPPAPALVEPAGAAPSLSPPPLSPPPLSPPPLPPPPLPPLPPPLPWPPPPPRAVQVIVTPAARWAAIACASVLFAVLHPMWTWPLIFLLSLGLGYAYERTGNLWVPVLMHLLFNSVQTAVFLAMR